MQKDIILVSSNAGKVAEVKAILTEFNVLSLKDIQLDLEVDETGLTFEENAILKVNALKDHYDYVIADDSGLEIEALDNQPGVLSHRFLGEDTPFEVKNPMVLEMMQDKENRNARFTSVIALSVKGEITTFKGILNGEITYDLRGTNGFGYNPIFLIPELSKTLAELNDEEKNGVSHRGIALKKLGEYLENE
ncbi:MAG: RdgB/HAM1 family non-canonical purine NTP pyrophosphatase [Erysipelothrix sp.]|nr:RdgB/HAM1 family non-canonical purine NTP pyrophosphatase [Erysipelothrix sp.]